MRRRWKFIESQKIIFKLIHENKDEMSSIKLNINIPWIISLAKKAIHKLTTPKIEDLSIY